MSLIHLFGCVCARVSVRVFVFAFGLLGYRKCKISFDFSQVLFKSQWRAAKYIPKYMATSNFFERCGFFFSLCVMLYSWEKLLRCFLPLPPPPFCANKTKPLARQHALTVLFLLLCEVWCHHLAPGKPLFGETPINGLSVLLIYMLRNWMGIARRSDSHFPFS